MSRTIAVFGAGSGLGLATARRFAREGFRVALVGRTQAKLDALLDQIGGDAVAFTADVTDHDQLARTVSAITERFGGLDVVEFGATGMDEVLAGPLDLDVAALRAQLELRLVAPVALTRLVLPAMVDCGSGALLYATGISATQPMAALSNIGAASAGLRNYVHTLHGEAAAHGVYAGLLIVAGLVDRSEAQQRWLRHGGAQVPWLDPDVLAETYWTMYTGRDQVERVVSR
jgi:NADP-dependent 3-hydroxy acid dehydrogenase YdfG